MRLFITIEIPDAWRATAEAAAATLARRARLDLRISDSSSRHLTARFLGEVDDADVPAVVAALDEIQAAPCELRLSAPGTFGPAAQTRVVWLGVEGDRDCLGGLTGAVDEAVRTAGLTLDQPPWRPHLTLARVRPRASGEERQALAELVRTLPAPRQESFVADTIALYRSHSGGRPPRYELLTTVRIG